MEQMIFLQTTERADDVRGVRVREAVVDEPVPKLTGLALMKCVELIVDPLSIQSLACIGNTFLGEGRDLEEVRLRAIRSANNGALWTSGRW